MNKKQERWGLYLLLPIFLLLGSSVFYPLSYGVFLAFTNRGAFSPHYQFVGLQNFWEQLHSSDFYQSLWNGIIFAGMTMFFQVVAGLVTALILNESFRGRLLARGLLLFPYLMPFIAAVTLWRWMYDDMVGIINYFLLQSRIIKTPIPWLATTSTAMLAVIICNIWKFFPFVTIIFLAKLTTIPISTYEAAQVDGASVWQRFIYITLPQLRKVLVIVVLIRGIWMFNKFDSVWLLTQGGPLGSTQHLPILIYKEAFGQFRLGSGAAVAVISLLFLLVGAILYIKLFRPIEEVG